MIEARKIPPSPPRLPLLGNIIGFARDRHALLRKGRERFGPVFSFRLGPKSVAVLLGPEFHQTFFLETDKALSIEKPYENLAALFGKVAFLAPRDAYLEQRPILHAPFRPEKMQAYASIMQREIQKWIDGLGREGEMEITGEMGGLVQTVAGYTLMGPDFQERVGAEFWELYAVLGKALGILTPPHWPLPKNIRRDKAKRRMQELLRPIIAERRSNPHGHEDFLQDFVETRGKSGDPADDETIVSLIRALMFASHETTAGQSAWTLIELLRHPEYHSLARAESREHLSAGVPVDGTVMRRLIHSYWAVRETERMHPSADILLRLAEEDLDIGGYHIPKGWLVMVSPAVAHRLPEVFADPDRFDPMRFSPGRQEDRRHPFALIGFGGGTHKCAGMSFANNEMMLIASMAVGQLDMELLTPDPGTHYGLGAGRPEKTRIRYRRSA
jgi:sterol 14alpha-demethylase